MKAIQLKIYGLVLLAVIYGSSAMAVGSQTRPVDNRAQTANAQNIDSQTIGTIESKDAKIIDFDFTDFNGKTRQVSEFSGKIVLLDFWATWCAPC